MEYIIDYGFEKKRVQTVELIGSPKQITWANKIRGEILEKIYTNPGTVKSAKYVTKITSAKWFIEHRNESSAVVVLDAKSAHTR